MTIDKHVLFQFPLIDYDATKGKSVMNKGDKHPQEKEMKLSQTWENRDPVTLFMFCYQEHDKLWTKHALSWSQMKPTTGKRDYKGWQNTGVKIAATW